MTVDYYSVMRQYTLLTLEGLNMNTSEYLSAAKKALGIESDYALSQRLDVTRQTISKLQSGKHTMSDETAVKIAAIIGKHPAMVLADAHAEREKDPVIKAIWNEVFQGFPTLLLHAKITPVYLGFNRRKQ